MSGAPERMAAATSRALPLDWADMVLPYFPNAPATIVEQCLMTVLHDFFTKTLLWTAKSPWLAGDGTTTTFVVPSPEPDTSVVYVFDAISQNGLRLLPQPVVSDPGPTPRPYPGYWMQFVSDRQGVVTFNEPVPLGESVRFTVAMAPKTLRLPEVLLREVQGPIVLGVRAWMHGMPLKPWSDAAAAERLTRHYEREVGRAKVRARHGRASVQLLQRVPDWAGVR